MLRLAQGFLEKHRRLVQREWLVASAIALVTLTLLALYLLDAVDPDLGIGALSAGLFLLVYPLPLAILLAWKSTFTARIGVSFERPLPPPFVRDRLQERSGRALARSWVELSALARMAGIPGLDEFGVGGVRDLPVRTTMSREGSRSSKAWCVRWVSRQAAYPIAPESSLTYCTSRISSSAGQRGSNAFLW